MRAHYIERRDTEREEVGERLRYTTCSRQRLYPGKK